jgi:hypothetical protein
MTAPGGQNQHNNANHIIANQHGPQNIYINQGPNAPQQPAPPVRRPQTGRALLIILAVDVAFFGYGAAAYTGESNNLADLGRAVIFLILLATTGTLFRRWVRNRY